jgi:SNF2 family DNA or RNA helicase
MGTEDERVKALKTPAVLYSINYENLPWLVKWYGDKWPFEVVVADESTRLKGFRLRQGTQRAKALGKVAHSKVKRFIELTGTPAPNGLIDLWGQAWFLDKGERLGATFSAFEQRWFQKVPIGRQFFKVRPLAAAQSEIQARLADLCLSLRPEDHFSLRAPVVKRIEVDLPPEAKKHYRALEKEMFTKIAGSEIVADNAAAKTMKCLQLCNGAVYDDSGQWHAVHDAKLDALQSVIEEAAGMPVLVAYWFRSDCERILKRFAQAKVLKLGSKVIDAWNRGEIPMLLVHPQSAGHGLNLQHGGNLLAFFGHWWDLELRQQVIERIGPVRQMQAGYDRVVFVYDIVAKGTVDELVVERHETKREVQDLLMSAMSRREEKADLSV